MAPLAKTTARGYGSPHQKLLARLRQRYTPGQPCAECGQPIHPGQPVHLAHDHINGGYKGLAHRRCNIAEANRRRARKPPRVRRPPPAKYSRW